MTEEEIKALMARGCAGPLLSQRLAWALAISSNPRGPANEAIPFIVELAERLEALEAERR